MSPAVTSAGNLQAALAHLLVDDQLRQRLGCDPDAVRVRFGLSLDQITALRGIDLRRLELTSQLGRAKRLDFVSRGLPLTRTALSLNGMHNVMHDFSHTVAPRVESGACSRTLNEGRRFVRYLGKLKAASGDLDWIGDLATYELTRLELLDSAEASRWARHVIPAASMPPDPVESSESTVVTGRHVRIMTFGYDVIAIAAMSSRGEFSRVDPAQTTLTMIKRPTPPLLVDYRTGPAMADVLLFCMTTRAVSEVYALLGDHDADRVIDAAISSGALCHGVPFGSAPNSGS
jgi:hypothetical protein